MNYKKLVLNVIVLSIAGYAHASNLYFGGSLGYSALNTTSNNAFSTTPDSGGTTYRQDTSNIDDGGLGGSLFAGYTLSPFWALELGYTSYADSDYKATQSEYNSGDLSSTSSAKLSYSTHSYDLFLKGKLPITEQVAAFGKVGLSYVSQEVTYSNDGSTTIPINSGSFAEPELGSSTYHSVRPAGGMGLHFNLNDWLATEVFAQGFLGKGDISTDQDAIASGYLVGASLIFTIA